LANRRKQLLLLVPGLCGFLIFYALPFVYSLYNSVIKSSFDKSFVGIANYITLLKNEYYRLALKNTFQFTIIGVPLLVFISFILAILMIKQSGRMRVCRTSFVIPMLLPSAAVVLIWQVLFSRNSILMSNFFNSFEWLKTLGLYKVPVYIFFIWKNTGYNMILFMSGLLSIPNEIYEASEMDGVSFLKKHIHISFPLLLPTTFFVIIISMVNSFKIFKEVYLLYGSYPDTSIYLVQHYMNNHFNKLNYQNLTTGALIFTIIVYIVVAFGYTVENKLNKNVW